MVAFMLATYFRRVEMSKSAAAVLQAILSKANIYGKHARVPIVTLMAISGYGERSVQYATKELQEKGLLHVDRRPLRFCVNAINVYHVVVPWRCDPLAAPAAKPYWYKKSAPAKRLHPTILEGQRPAPTPCSEAEATRWHTPGSKTWYMAQGLEPPGEEISL